MKPLDIISNLKDGKDITLRPSGNSMTPMIFSKQKITVSPIIEDLKIGDIVYSKVKGKYYFHLISAIDNDRVQISNNHGHVNGWTSKSKVYGIVTKVEN